MKQRWWQRRPRAGALERRWTMAGGVRVAVTCTAREGNRGRPAVVLVHGTVISSSYMLPLARRLSRWVDVYAPDLPGHGHSGHPRQALSVDQQAEALVQIMDAFGLASAALVGNSMGAQVVAAVAARWPSRAERLVLISPTVDPARREVGNALARMFVDAFQERKRLVLLEAIDLWRMGFGRARQEARLVLADHIEARLPRIHAPTLVLRGTDDPVVSAEWAARVTGMLHAAALHEIPDAGHAPHYSAVERVVEVLAPFLREARPEVVREATPEARPRTAAGSRQRAAGPDAEPRAPG